MQYSETVEERRKDLIDESMDKTWTCIYAQWDKTQDNHKEEDCIQTYYASGRKETVKFAEPNKVRVTWHTPMRRWLFKLFIKNGR